MRRPRSVVTAASGALADTHDRRSIRLVSQVLALLASIALAVVAPAVMANAVGFNMARSVGPAIGGVLVATVGAAAAFIVNAVSYVGIIATLAWWRPKRLPGDLPPEPLGAAIAAGLHRDDRDRPESLVSTSPCSCRRLAG